MYSQVYFHPVRRIYDIHLRDFLQTWLSSGKFNTDLGNHLNLTDNEVTQAIFGASRNNSAPGYEDACRIVNHDHFKRLYERNPKDLEITPKAGKAIYDGLVDEFGSSFFRHDSYTQKGSALDFPIRMTDGRVVSSLAF